MADDEQIEVNLASMMLEMQANLLTTMEAQAKILSLLKNTDFTEERLALNESSRVYRERLLQSMKRT